MKIIEMKSIDEDIKRVYHVHNEHVVNRAKTFGYEGIE